ncbi:MAG: adenylate kinase family protein [Candidatus Hermodarchaeota archaeon]|nr:adenylate kinase family protein [Candidatus Hermodarchaeota archaeon]
MPSVIAISGTPGTGKTGIGQLLVKRLNATLIELSHLAKEQQLLLGEDLKRETLIADTEKLQQYLINLIREFPKTYVIVGHFADEVPEKILEFLVVLRCNPITLTQRLSNRQWSQSKILENVQAEILGECTMQALLRHKRDKVFEIDTTEATLKEVADAIEVIQAGTSHEYTVGHISWLSTLDPRIIHEIMEENTLPSKS